MLAVAVLATFGMVAVQNANADCSITSTLRVGSVGVQVQCLQTIVGASADGKFGPLTKAAVMAWQSGHGLVADGVVGPLTRAALAGAPSSGGLPAGCTSTSGFSPTTGAPCNSGTGTGLPAGCTSTSGFSPTTGQSCSGGGAVVVTGVVTVSLASDNPAAGTLLIDDTTGVMQNATPVLKLNFANGTSSEVKVNTVKLTRTGIASDGDVNNVYLYDGATKLADMSSVSNKIFSFNNSGGLFTVPANSSRAIWVGVSMTADTAGANSVGFTVNSASDVVTTASTTGGSFPISGNLFQTAFITDLGYINLSSTTTFPATVNPSTVSQELWRFTATANAQKMAVKRIVLTMVGTISPGDLQDLTLTVAGVQVGATAQIGSDNKVVFDLSGAPYQILSGQNKVFVLNGIVAKGTGRAFKFTIRSTADFVSTDLNYNVDTAPLNAGAALTVVDPDADADGTNINNGTITVSRSTNSPTGNIVSGGLDVALARFDYKAAGEDIKVAYVRVNVNNSQGVTMNDGKLYFNGSQVGTTDDSVADVTVEVYSLGNTVIIPAGTTGVFEYRANVEQADGTDLTADGTVVVTLNAGSSGDAVGQTSLTNLTPASATGNTLTIKTGTLTATKNSAFADRTSTNPNGVKGATHVKVASFVVTAGSGEAVNITQMVVGDDGDNTSEDFGDNFQNLVLEHNGVSISSSANGTLSGTAGADFTFNISPTVTVAAGQQYVVDAYADILTGAAGFGTARTGLEFVSVSATGVNTSADASYSTVVDLQNVYIATSGALTLSLDSDTPAAAQYVMGSTDQTLAKFKFAASSSEDIDVSKIVVAMTGGVAATDDEASVRGDFGNYRLYKSTDLVNPVGTVASAGVAGTTSEDLDGLITFEGLSLRVPANGSVVLVLKADVSTYPNATSSNAAGDNGVVFSLQYDTNTELGAVVTAQGVGSGADLSTDAASADLSANSATVYRTKLTVAYASDSPNGSSSGMSGQVVAKYIVSNSANAGNFDATLELFGQSISSTIALTAEVDRNVKIYKDTITTGNLLATVEYDTHNTISCTPAATLACIDSGDSGDTTEDRFGATNANTTDGLTGARFVDVVIAAGSSKTIWVTADTQDATSDKSFTIQPISTDAATGVAWGDGITTTILHIDSLPLVPVKTLTY